MATTASPCISWYLAILYSSLVNLLLSYLVQAVPLMLAGIAREVVKVGRMGVVVAGGRGSSWM
jgi:hypothetical protein